MQDVEKRRGTIPAYKKVETHIRDHIQTGRWREDAMLPSRLGLAKEFNVSLGTIERAVANLIDDGVLRADSRRGTFVAHQNDGPSDHAGASLKPLDAPHGGDEETLGIIASYPVQFLNNSDYLFYWIPQIAYSIASAFLDARERTLTFNIYPAPGLVRPQPLVPIAAALDSLRLQGATSVAIIDVHNEIDELDLERFAARLESYKMPIVHISGRALDLPLPHLFVNTAMNGALAARFLIEQGHTSITFVSPYEHDWVRQRFHAARQIALRLGLPEDAVRFWSIEHPLSGDQDAGNMHAASYECGRQLFLSGSHNWALIAADDSIAYGVIDAGKELGLTPGKDYSIVGFDDAPKSMHYGLTTFRPPFERLGEETSMMLKRMAVGQPVDFQIGFQSRLTVRASTRGA